MGRKKIKIQPIKEDRNRSVTYLKRKAGLFKKAHELAVLTDSQVAVIVFGHNGKLAEFCSTDIDLLLLRYTEHDGVAERKGPQNYLNLDKDSDDDDDDNDDNNIAGGEGQEDDLAGSWSGNGGGSGSGKGEGSGRNRSAKMSGVKRKAEQASPSSSRLNSSVATSAVGAGFGAGIGRVNISPSAKQTINAAIRRKSQIQSARNTAMLDQLPSQGDLDPLSFDQSYLSGTGVHHGMAEAGASSMGRMESTSAVADGSSHMPDRVLPSGASVNASRADAIANMSIPMPDHDRVPIFLSPATPGFGLTPNGTVTTPGGRRFSFSDFLTRGSASSTTQRPVTSNSLLAPSLFQNDAFGMSTMPAPAFSSFSNSMSPQPSHDALSSPKFRSGAPVASRPASADVLRSTAPLYNEATYASASGASMAPRDMLTSSDSLYGSPLGTAVTLDHSNTVLAPLGTDFAPNLDRSSATPVPHASSLDSSSATRMQANTFNASPFISLDLKSSATPVGGSQSSATPELISHGKSVAPRMGLAASVSRSSMSTDEETPPLHGEGAAPDQGAAFHAHTSHLNTTAAWLDLDQGVGPKQEPVRQGLGTLVQPVPINATQTPSSMPFDLKLPARRRQ